MTAVIAEARFPDDADALARVYVASAAHHAALDPARYRVPPLDAVARRYREPRPDTERILVARLGRDVAGFASVALLPPPGPASMLADVTTATLDVAVLPENRGRGIGRRLLEAAATAAAGLGAARLQLDAHHANEGALRLYRYLGYQPMGVLLSRVVL
ncbi:GNAT family N-acetyltransferase [Jiangella alkaliphila]|uniref:Acetyltransferase (GNAT) family protein n=1 Tax=Jiangella alkaliphila TaxID=419479 RepID=A0A1H2II09_9ACTN|nr:GNAT family N-acetyltransferase [Jiangella alkaliphila]SDU43625.1 Acetyltransferase (GNAT) family protein [Jiangella alkaliphila]